MLLEEMYISCACNWDFLLFEIGDLLELKLPFLPVHWHISCCCNTGLLLGMLPGTLNIHWHYILLL